MYNLYIVEGKTDKNKLESIGCKYIYVLDGLDGLNQTKINFLKLASKQRKLICLIDPDVAGNLIKQTLQQNINNITFIEVNKTQ